MDKQAEMGRGQEGYLGLGMILPSDIVPQLRLR
jgi:hypothetical protein